MSWVLPPSIWDFLTSVILYSQQIFSSNRVKRKCSSMQTSSAVKNHYNDSCSFGRPFSKTRLKVVLVCYPRSYGGSVLCKMALSTGNVCKSKRKKSIHIHHNCFLVLVSGLDPWDYDHKLHVLTCVHSSEKLLELYILVNYLYYWKIVFESTHWVLGWKQKLFPNFKPKTQWVERQFFYYESWVQQPIFSYQYYIYCSHRTDSYN